MGNVLVLGNGPCLTEELKDEDLSRFDKVIRVNAWEDIPGYDNRCDVWVCYARHHLGYENRFNVLEQAKRAKELWNAWEFSNDTFVHLFKRQPDKLLSSERANHYLTWLGAPVQPTAGWYALFMAIEYVGFGAIHVAGFDFFQSDKRHYYDKGRDLWKAKVKFHDPGLENEKLMYEACIRTGLFEHIKGKEWYFERTKKK